MPIDPFDPGTSVAQEFPTQEPDTLRRLWQIIAAQKRAMFDLRASVLANVSDVVADLTAKQATLTAQQATLTDLVSKVVTSSSDKAFNAGAGVTATRTVKATATVTVPAGFTKAQVWAFSDAMALNSTASPDYLYVGTKINTYDGGENYIGCQPGYANSVSHSAVTALTGLTGGDPITCNVTSNTLAPWAANAANLWRIQVVVIFSR